MSYFVTITSLPLPDNDEEAWDRLVEIDQANEGTFGTPGPEMEKLYRRLSERFPCIIDAPESPWSDGPLRNNFGRDMATVGISNSRVEEALPFVIETATEMGCTVLDGTDERIHRPAGWRPPSVVERATHSGPAQQRRPWWKLW
jgi:hypothetical protein